MEWYLYILDCDGRYYTGITKDPRRRLEEHRAGGRRGAKFTRAAKLHEPVYTIAIGDRGMALRAEARLKKLARAAKEDIVREAPARTLLLERLGLEAAPAETGKP